MSVLSKEFLESIGVKYDESSYTALVEHFDTTLKQRIIESIIDTLDDSQVKILLEMQTTDSDQLWQWIQANVPELGEIIQEEVDILLGELAEHSESI